MPQRTRLLLASGLCALAAAPALALDCLPDYPHYIAAPISAPEGTYRITGYNDMAEMLAPMSALFSARHPGYRFELALEGTRTAPAALINGASFLAPMGAEWSDADLAAFRASHGSTPVTIRVAHDSLNPLAKSSPAAIVVHASNPLATITLAQAQQVFMRGGRIAHWSQLTAGKTGAIHPVGFGETTAVGQFLRRHKFGEAPFAEHYVGKLQSREVIDAVAADPSAIGLANLNHVTPQVRALGIASRAGGRPSFGTRRDIAAGRYPFDRQLYVSMRRGRDGRIEPLARAWAKLLLSCEGQAIIAGGSLGYIPLSPREAARERQKMLQINDKQNFPINSYSIKGDIK